MVFIGFHARQVRCSRARPSRWAWTPTAGPWGSASTSWTLRRATMATFQCFLNAFRRSVPWRRWPGAPSSSSGTCTARLWSAWRRATGSARPSGPCCRGPFAPGERPRGGRRGLGEGVGQPGPQVASPAGAARACYLACGGWSSNIPWPAPQSLRLQRLENDVEEVKNPCLSAVSLIFTSKPATFSPSCSFSVGP